jgi:hypothetical protein
MPRSIFEERLVNLSTDAHRYLLEAASSRDAPCCELPEGSVLVQLAGFVSKGVCVAVPADLERILEQARDSHHSHVHFAPSPSQTEIDVAFDYFYGSGARCYLQPRGFDRSSLSARSFPQGRSAEEYCEMLQAAVGSLDASPVSIDSNRCQLSELWCISLSIIDAKACMPGAWWLCDEIVRIVTRLLDHFIEQIGAHWAEHLASFERTVFGARSALASSLRAPIATHVAA